MNVRYQILIATFALSLAGGLVWVAMHYHGKYLDEEQRADAAEQSLSLANATINDMQTRQRDVSALDAKYTGELADAKAAIDKLHNDVADGRRRLQLNATCTKNNSTSAIGLGNASAPELAGAAIRDYWRLRDGINTVTGQVKYLQDYIRQQCLK